MNKTGIHNNRVQLDGRFNPTPVPQNSQMNPTYQPRYQEPYREIPPTFRRDYASPFPAPQIHPNERLLGNRPAPVQNQPLRDPIRNQLGDIENVLTQFLIQIKALLPSYHQPSCPLPMQQF